MAETRELSINGFTAPCALRVMTEDRKLLAAVVYGKGEVPKKVAAVISTSSNSSTIASIYERCLADEHHAGRQTEIMSPTTAKYKTFNEKVGNPWHRVTTSYIISEELGKKYLLTDTQRRYDDFYAMAYEKTTLPIGKDWAEPLFMEMKRKGALTDLSPYSRIWVSEDIEKININETLYDTKSLELYLICDIEKNLIEAVKNCFVQGKIKMCDNPRSLEVTDMDTYLEEHSEELIQSLDHAIVPKRELSGEVMASCKNHTLLSQQAVCVNGMVAQLQQCRSVIACEGMGCGKTKQALQAIEAYVNEEYMEKNHITDLKEVYSEENQKNINYNVLVVCPGHLVSKWGDEIRGAVVGASIHEIQSLGDLEPFVRLRPKGKHLYVISKDTLKADAVYTPTPTAVKTLPMEVKICATCEEKSDIGAKVIMNAHTHRCPVCGGTKGKDIKFKKATGLICPTCSRLLLPNNIKAASFDDMLPLTPDDFASGANTSNSHCMYCGTSLWGPEVKRKTTEEHSGLFDLTGAMDTATAENIRKELGRTVSPKAPHWYRIKHFVSASEKVNTQKTSWVLSGYENYFIAGKPFEKRPIEIARLAFPERASIAEYIKKKVKHFFDFFVMDEVHKYAGDSAQGAAVHKVSTVCTKLIALTGTLSNGHADSLWNILWMLCPDKMIRRGFTHNDLQAFCNRYGTSETKTLVDTTDGEGSVYGGKVKKGSKRQVAGLSPAIYPELLCDMSVMLDLSDFSDDMPEFKEIIRQVPLEPAIYNAYKKGQEAFKKAFMQPGGGSRILAAMLQFSLSYTDYPVNREPIYTRNGELIFYPPSFEQYIEGGGLFNKEEELLSIIQDELNEGRNCVVYLQRTDPKSDGFLMRRLYEIIRSNLNLAENEVQMLFSSKPKASDREEWMHNRAREGAKVFLCNPKCVETGLDFVWSEGDVEYNFPTLIFYQLGYEIASQLQASRRAYRIIQRTECRVYYIVSENCIQTEVLNIAATKVKAINTIQGRFSADGLASMAEGVDERAVLAERLADSSKKKAAEEIQKLMDDNNMFSSTCEYAGFKVTPEYHELMGITNKESVKEALLVDLFSFDSSLGTLDQAAEDAAEENSNTASEEDAFKAAFDSFFEEGFSFFVEPKTKKDKKKKKKKKKVVEVDVEEEALFSIFS